MNRRPPSIESFFPDAQPVWPMGQQHKGPRLTKIDQISILVTSVEKAAEYYAETLGWGPFYFGRVHNTLPYRGQPSEFEVRLAFAWVGDESGGIEVELMEVVEGDTPHRDHLLAKGEGLQHIRLPTADVEGTLEHLATLGIEPIFGYKTDKWMNVFVNSHNKFGLRVEFIRTDHNATEKETSWRREP
jgi:catechol 2,3-dioxygenase-like lactoylglutathione lyase family enzyme